MSENLETQGPARGRKTSCKTLFIWFIALTVLAAVPAVWYFTGPGLTKTAEFWLTRKSGLPTSIEFTDFSWTSKILTLKNVRIFSPSGSTKNDMEGSQAVPRAITGRAEFTLRPVGFIGLGHPFSGATIEGVEIRGVIPGGPALIRLGDRARIETGSSGTGPLMVRVITGSFEVRRTDGDKKMLLSLPGAVMNFAARQKTGGDLSASAPVARAAGIPFTLEKPSFVARISDAGILDMAELKVEVSGMKILACSGRVNETQSPTPGLVYAGISIEGIQTKWAAGTLSLARMFYPLPAWVGEIGRILQCPQLDGTMNLDMTLTGKPSGGAWGFEGWITAAREIAHLKSAEAKAGRFAVAASEFALTVGFGMTWASELWNASASATTRGGAIALMNILASPTTTQPSETNHFVPLPMDWTGRMNLSGIPAFGLEGIVSWIANAWQGVRRLQSNGSDTPVTLAATLRGPSKQGADDGGGSIKWEGLPHPTMAEWMGIMTKTLTTEAPSPSSRAGPLSAEARGQADLIWPGPEIRMGIP